MAIQVLKIGQWLEMVITYSPIDAGGNPILFARYNEPLPPQKVWVKVALEEGGFDKFLVTVTADRGDVELKPYTPLPKRKGLKNGPIRFTISNLREAEAFYHQAPDLFREWATL